MVSVKLTITDCTAQITNIKKVDNVYMEETYHGEVTIRLSDECEEPQEVKFKWIENDFQTELTLQREDVANVGTEMAMMEPGESRVFKYSGSHTWDWTNRAGDSCSSVIEGLAQTAATTTIDKTFKSKYIKAGNVENALTIGGLVWDMYQTIPENDYGFRFEVSLGGNLVSVKEVTIGDVGRVRVRVKPRQAAAFGLFIADIFAQIPATGIGIAGISAGGPVGWAGGGVMLGLEAALMAESCELLKIATGPHGANAGKVETQEEGANVASTLPSFQVVTYSKLLAEELNKYESTGQISHLQQAKTYARDLLEAVQARDQEIEDVIAMVEEDGITFNDTDRDIAQNELYTNGLPEEEKTILRDYGYTDADFPAFANWTALMIDAVPDDWKNDLRAYSDEDIAVTQFIYDEISLELESKGVAVYLPLILKNNDGSSPATPVPNATATPTATIEPVPDHDADLMIDFD